MSNDTVLTSEKPTMDFLPVDLDYVTKELEIRSKTELFEDENARIQSLELLRSMLETEENLRWQNDELFLLAFLRARKFDVKRAFNLIKGFYTSFGKHRDICNKLNFPHKKILMERQFCILPYRDRENCVILLLRCCPWDKAFCIAELLFYAGFALLQALRSPSTQVAGLRMIFNFAGCTMRHIIATTPTSLKFFPNMIQNALPLRMKGLHIVNEIPLFASYFWPLTKLFVPKKLCDRVHFHGKDMESLQKFFHPSILPADLGGELPPSYEEDWRERMESSSEYINHVLSFGYEKYLRKG